MAAGAPASGGRVGLAKGADVNGIGCGIRVSTREPVCVRVGVAAGSATGAAIGGEIGCGAGDSGSCREERVSGLRGIGGGHDLVVSLRMIAVGSQRSGRSYQQ